MKLKELLKLEFIKHISENKYKCNKCNNIFSKFGITNHHFYQHETEGIKRKQLLSKIALKNNNQTEMKKKISEKTKEAFQREDVKNNFQKYVEREKTERKGKDNPMYGKMHTNEWKLNHSKTMTGFKHTDETKKYLREINIGKKHTKESIKKMQKSKLGKKANSKTKLKMSVSRLGKKHSGVTKEKIRKTKLSELNPMFGKFRTINYIKDKYPIFFKEEEMTEIYINKTRCIQVHCKNHNCPNSKEKEGWFIPTGRQIEKRLWALENKNGNDGSYFYCSDECKNKCPLYNLHSDPFKKAELSYTNEEYATWKQFVLEQDNHKCQKCGSKENLHCHHINPVKTHPHLSLDPMNGIVLCKFCHYEIGHKDECSTDILANKICKEKINDTI